MIAGNHNIGHGWVMPRQDGVKARCGGPGLCMDCQAEAMMLRAHRRHPTTDSRNGRGE